MSTLYRRVLCRGLPSCGFAAGVAITAPAAAAAVCGSGARARDARRRDGEQGSAHLGRRRGLSRRLRPLGGHCSLAGLWRLLPCGLVASPGFVTARVWVSNHSVTIVAPTSTAHERVDDGGGCRLETWRSHLPPCDGGRWRPPVALAGARRTGAHRRAQSATGAVPLEGTRPPCLATVARAGCPRPARTASSDIPDGFYR
jgi:hypothetical protein